MTTGILVLLWAHFFSDFVVQPDKFALNKWHSEKALLGHIGVYTLSMFLWVWLALIPDYGYDTMPYFAAFILVNGFFHFFTDYATSKDMHDLWLEKDYRMFFIYIGLDQFFHLAVLVLTYSILIHLVI